MSEKFKTTISESERLQLLGLLTLARQHSQIVDQCSDGIDEILEVQGFEKGGTHLHDSIWDKSAEDFDSTLKKMGIKIHA